jgi:hypothetical protein
LGDAKRLPLRYWLVVALGVAFTLERFSEAFSDPAGLDVGLALRFVPAIMIAMNIVCALFACPAGGG